MKLLMILGGLLMPAVAFADTAAPSSLGVFGDWTAATYGVGAKKACYAFTIAQGSSAALAGRGPVMLVVTERKSGHDEVTISAGYTYPAKPKVMLDINGDDIAFYTQGQTAFTTSGAQAITDFQQGSLAKSTASIPGGGTVIDIFSLAGFADAYNAITTTCP